MDSEAENFSNGKPQIRGWSPDKRYSGSQLHLVHHNELNEKNVTASMATAFNRLSHTALRYTYRIPSRKKCKPLAPHFRKFHTSPLYRAKDDTEAPSKPTRQPFKFSLSDLDPEERAAYKSLSPEERQQWQEEARQMHDYMTSPDIESQLQADVSQAAYETAEESPHVPIEIPRIKPGFFAMGETEEQDSGEDEEFEGDDLSSLGHAELEQHREMRHYARIMAWEMPLLSSAAATKSFPFFGPSY